MVLLKEKIVIYLALLETNGLYACSKVFLAVFTACHLINRVPSFVLESKTSFSVFYLETQQLIFLQMFFDACILFKFLKKDMIKLDFRAVQCLFLGYSRI